MFSEKAQIDHFHFRWNAEGCEKNVFANNFFLNLRILLSIIFCPRFDFYIPSLHPNCFLSTLSHNYSRMDHFQETYIKGFKANNTLKACTKYYNLKK